MLIINTDVFETMLDLAGIIVEFTFIVIEILLFDAKPELKKLIYFIEISFYKRSSRGTTFHYYSHVKLSTQYYSLKNYNYNI